MPTNMEIILEGMRGLAQAAGNYNDRRAKAEEGRAKEESERAKKERLKAIGIELQDLSDKADADPEYDEAKLARDGTPIVRQIMESGDMGSMKSLELIQDKAKARSTAARDKAKEAKQDTKDAAKSSKEATDLDLKRKTIAQDISAKHRKASETSIGMQNAYNTIVAAAEGKPNGAKDLQLVTAYMKSIDPGSTVRETEFKNAAEARSFWSANTRTDENGNLTTKGGIPLPGFVVQAIQKYEVGSEGGFLLPEQREAFLDAAETNYEKQLIEQESVDDNYDRQLKDIGDLDRDTYLTFNAKKERGRVGERRTKAKAAKEKKKKDDDLKLVTDEDGKKQKAKVVDQATLQKIMDANKEKFTAAVQAAEQRRAAEGKPPFSPQEKQSFIVEILKQNGIKTAPAPKK